MNSDTFTEDDVISFTSSPTGAGFQADSNTPNQNASGNLGQNSGNTDISNQAELCSYFPGSSWCQDYATNLARIQGSSVRSKVEDGSIYRDVPQDDLIVANLLGPRSEYLDAPGGNPERAFPTDNGVGNFRIGCEFSHFAYDDPFMHPGKPGASYLQMFFGNTDVNAYSTYESLRNRGGSTCNGHELNRSGYWVPAMFDGDGYVRVPERVVIYYKGYGDSNGRSIAFPEKSAIVSRRVHTIESNQGGSPNQAAYKCSDQFSANANQSDVLQGFNCDAIGNPVWKRTVLEVVIKFPQCWAGDNPDDFENSYSLPKSNWFGSDCEDMGYENLPNIEYFVNYPLEDGETVDDWFLASDVSPDTLQLSGTRGDSVNGKWWGAWRKDVNQDWVDNCVNHQANGERAGCGFGYLSNGGPDGQNPRPGPALKYREQYTGPIKVPVEQVFSQLCDTDRALTSDASAAWCNPQ